MPLTVAVATLSLLDFTLKSPLQEPLSTVNALVVVGYVIVPLVGLTLILHVPRFTVRVYVALDAA